MTQALVRLPNTVPHKPLNKIISGGTLFAQHSDTYSRKKEKMKFGTKHNFGWQRAYVRVIANTMPQAIDSLRHGNWRT